MRRASPFLLLALLVPAAPARSEVYDRAVIEDPRGAWRVEGLSGEIPTSGAWGRIRAERVHLLGREIARDVEAQATRRNDVLSVRGIEADALGGKIEAGIALDTRRTEEIRSAFLLRVTRIDLARLAFLLPTDLGATGALSGEVEVQAIGSVPVRATGRLASVGGGEILVPERLRRRARELPARIRYRSLEITLFESENAPRARITVVPEGTRSLADLLRGRGPRRFIFDLPLAPLFLQ